VSVNVVAVIEVAVPVVAAAAAAFPFVVAVLAVVDVGVLLVPNWRANLLALLWFSLAVSPGCFCRCDQQQQLNDCWCCLVCLFVEKFNFSSDLFCSGFGLCHSVFSVSVFLP
jgi:hypothetical protein